MPTAEDLFQRLAAGADFTLRTTFVEPVTGPDAQGHTLAEIMAIAPAPDNVDGASPADVGISATYWGLRTDGGWGPQVGTRVPAAVARTGQATCYDEHGTTVECAGTGQDGDLRLGVEWPVPRFTDNGDGTVTDNLTGLIWLQNANCFSERTWMTALGDASTLASGSCGLSDGSVAGEWRLPNANELLSLVDFGHWPTLSNAAGSGQWAEGDAFHGVVAVGDMSGGYWTSTTWAAGGQRTDAWCVYFSWGKLYSSGKGEVRYVWPVRGGD